MRNVGREIYSCRIGIEAYNSLYVIFYIMERINSNYIFDSVYIFIYQSITSTFKQFTATIFSKTWEIRVERQVFLNVKLFFAYQRQLSRNCCIIYKFINFSKKRFRKRWITEIAVLIKLCAKKKLGEILFTLNSARDEEKKCKKKKKRHGHLKMSESKQVLHIWLASHDSSVYHNVLAISPYTLLIRLSPFSEGWT